MTKTINWDENFPITGVCRKDLKESFNKEQIASLSNSDMVGIASKMADLYCDSGFWVDLGVAVERALEEKR